MVNQGLINPHIDFLSSIILFGVLQGGLILIVFFNKKPVGYSFLMFLLGIMIVQQVESFLYYSGYIIYTLHLYSVSLPLVFLCGPAITGYTSKIIGASISQKKLFYHFIPFILYSLYTFFFFLQPAEKKLHHYISSVQPHISLATPKQPFNADPLEIQGYIVVELISLYLIVYGIYGLVRVYHLKENLKKKKLVSWLSLLHIILICSGIILLLAEGGVIEGQVIYNSVLPNYMTRVYTTLSMYIITIYILFNSKIYTSGKKYEKSALSKEFRVSKLKKIITLLDEEKSYLSTSYNLNQLSQKTGISENHISEILNLELKLNFYELTNRYRINEAKLILDNDSENIKMEQLAYVVGYKSKSTFFNAFKKELSMTPLQYKKSRQS